MTMRFMMKEDKTKKINRNGTETKEKLLFAAKEIIVRDGVKFLSLDRVAQEATVAKGTLLYHFKNKEQLLIGLMQMYCNHLEGRLQEGMKAYDGHPDQVVLGFIKWFEEFYVLDKANTSFGLAILSQSTNNDKIHSIIEAWYTKTFDSVRQTCNQDENLIKVLALEGLFFLQHFKLNVLTQEENQRVVDRFRSELFK